ncbi:MAG: glycosyltransferase [Flavobacterium sp.]
MIFLLSFFVLIYVAAIIWLIKGFKLQPSFEPTEKLNPVNRFTIVVPFRNEAKNLPFLLDSFSKLKYPTTLFEIILVDDDSTDNFKIPDLPLPISIVKNKRFSNSPKKDAIATAIPLSRMEWIITTDADCTVHPEWLIALDNFIQQNNKVEMIAGAVTYDAQSNFLHQFQQLDLTGLQGTTIGSFGIKKPFMCNGANFAYTKSLFKAINGFEGNNKIASGDDVFLLQKAISQFPEKVEYLKSSKNIVITKPLDDWKSLFFQRVRWASKTKSYQNQDAKILATIVFGCNLSLISGGFMVFFGSISINELVILLGLKTIADFVLLYKTNKFLSHKKLDYLIAGTILYPLFSSAVALYSFFGNYSWKDRTFKQ